MSQLVIYHRNSNLYCHRCGKDHFSCYYGFENDVDENNQPIYFCRNCFETTHSKELA